MNLAVVEGKGSSAEETWYDIRHCRTGPGTSASPIAEGAEYRFPGGDTGQTSPSSADQESLRYVWTVPFLCVACWLMFIKRTALHLPSIRPFLGLDIS